MRGRNLIAAITPAAALLLSFTSAQRARGLVGEIETWAANRDFG
jgi:hypothetical protein